LFRVCELEQPTMERRFTHERAGDTKVTGRLSGCWFVHLCSPVRVSVDASYNRRDFVRVPQTRFHVTCVPLVCFMKSVNRFLKMNLCRPS
jgi:hypothetical protein